MTDRQQQGTVAVVVPAAGSGTRLGGQRKQFRLLGGLPLLVQTLLRFDRHPGIDRIVVAVPAGEEEGMRGLLAEHLAKPVTVVPGGDSRQASVYAGLSTLPGAVDLVLVHDAVRPFVEAAHIAAVIAAARTGGAAALAVPVVDTLRHGTEGVFGETVPRDGLYRMQTPQAIQRDLFERAHAEAERAGYLATDDVDLVRHLGHPVRIVEGGPLNMKITTPADWALAQRLWTLESPARPGA